MSHQLDQPSPTTPVDLKSFEGLSGTVGTVTGTMGTLTEQMAQFLELLGTQPNEGESTKSLHSYEYVCDPLECPEEKEEVI